MNRLYTYTNAGSHSSPVSFTTTFRLSNAATAETEECN